MLKNFWQNIIVYTLIIAFLLGSTVEVYSVYQKNRFPTFSKEDFLQPALPEGTFPWTVRSIDTQIVSKHWPDVAPSAIAEQVKLIAGLGVNYVAIDTPYDKIGEMRLWVTEIHNQHLHVWFRSHWDEWEGDDGAPATMSPDIYLYRTEKFIEANRDLFQAGDSFTMAVEAENVGVGWGKRFLYWDQYRDFLLSEVTVSNTAFKNIGLKSKVYTNWLSVNGWIVDNQLTPDVVSKIGLITVDHYVGQSRTIGDYSDAQTIASLTATDLDRFHQKFNVPIFLGEWGYQVFQTVPDDVQAKVIDELFKNLSTRKYLVGVNYWVHMGNSAAIIGDQFGSNLKYRPGALIIKSYFDPLSLLTPETKQSLSK